MFAVCLGMLGLCTALASQDPAPRPATGAPAPAPAAAPAPLPALDDRQARKLLLDFQKDLKGTPSMADRNRALQRLGQGAHASFVKPLGKVVTSDKSIVVRKRAAEILAQQPAEEAHAELLRLLGEPTLAGYPVVLGTVVRGLAYCGYRSEDWERIASLFEADYSPERVPLQEAILDLVLLHREKQSVELLLRNLDEPAPADPDDPANPPAEYWEARWKAWQAWRSRVKEALFRITGQRFGSASEAREWLRKNPLG